MKPVALILLSLFFFTGVAQQPKDQYKKVDGVLQVSRFYEDGGLRERGTFNEEGKPDGQWLLFSKEGNVTQEALYVDGVKQGKWFVWTADGNFLYEVVYQDNYLVKSNRWKIEERNLLAVD